MVGDPAPITQSAEEPGEKHSGTISQISGATPPRRLWRSSGGPGSKSDHHLKVWDGGKNDLIFVYFGIKKENKSGRRVWGASFAAAAASNSSDRQSDQIWP